MTCLGGQVSGLEAAQGVVGVGLGAGAVGHAYQPPFVVRARAGAVREIHRRGRRDVGVGGATLLVELDEVVEEVVLVGAPSQSSGVTLRKDIVGKFPLSIFKYK